MKQAVIYAAKSTEDTHGSIGTQLEDGRKLAARHGFTVAGEYQDEAKSAYHGNRGQGLADAIQHCERLGESALIVQHSDRLARGDGTEAQHLIELVVWAIKAGVELLSVQDPEVLAGGDFALTMGAIGGFRNHQDSKRKGASVKAGHRRRVAERGRFLGGKRPYGYDYRDRTEEGRGTGPLVPVEVEATAVRRMYAEYNAGKSQSAIARDLNTDGVRTFSGSRWYATTVKGILGNPIYVGRLLLHGETFPAVGPDGQPTHEPILDVEVWDQAQSLRSARHERGEGGFKKAGRWTSGQHLLTEGLLRCTCGAAMTPVTKSDKRAANGQGYETYSCLRRMHEGTSTCAQGPLKRELIDKAVFDYFERVALDLDSIRDGLQADAERSLADSGGIRRQAERELARAESSLNRVESDYLAGKIEADDWNRFRERLTGEIDAARAQVEQHERQRQVVEDMLSQFDADAAVAIRLTELRAEVAGQVREATTGDDLAMIRATLRRLFVGFELAGPQAPFGSGALAHKGEMWTGSGADAESLVSGDYVLLPRVRSGGDLLHSNLCSFFSA